MKNHTQSDIALAVSSFFEKPKGSYLNVLDYQNETT